MNSRNICKQISAKNTKTRIWVFIAAFLFSTGLYLVFKPQGDEIAGETLFLQALIYGVIFGLIFQYAVRHLNGVNLRPSLMEKSFSKLSESRKEEKLKLKIPAAKTGFFPKAGVLAISDSNVYFVPHKSSKISSITRESLKNHEFKLADFNADGKQKNVVFTTEEKSHRFLIFNKDAEAVEKELASGIY
jgi:zinc transporter ZupT